MLADGTDMSRTARRFGVSLRTLCFYEQIGLIKPLRRGSARVYTGGDCVRLELIATGRRLGLSLGQIRGLIEERAPVQGAGTDAGSIVSMLTKDEVEEQLQVLERQLADVQDAIADLRKSPSPA